MSRYITQFLICFIAYIFQTPTSSMGGNIIIDEWACCIPPLLLQTKWGSIKTQQNLSAPFPGRSWTEAQLAWSHWKIFIILEKPRDKIDNVDNHFELINQESSELGSLLYPRIPLIYFATVPSLMPAALVHQGHRRMFWCLQLSQISEMVFYSKVFALQKGMKIK